MKTNTFKHTIYAGIAVLTLGLASCDSGLLETVPNDRLSEDLFWKTENDAKLAVNSLYTDLDSIPTRASTWPRILKRGVTMRLVR